MNDSRLLREDIEETRMTMLMQSSVPTPNVKQNGFSHIEGERVARMRGAASAAARDHL